MDIEIYCEEASATLWFEKMSSDAWLTELRSIFFEKILFQDLLGFMDTRLSYTPVNYNSWLENPLFWWYLPGKMGIFPGYVSLP